MQFKQWQKEITNNLEVSLNKISPNHSFTDVLKYSIFPTGKLFRPLIVYSLANDLGKINENHKRLAESIEIHHTYTLIHDDLPAMDDDDQRRGRPSSHIKFSQWQAILAGDALLNSSYEILAQINHKDLGKLLRLYTSQTGQRGLILGQVFDLSGEVTKLEEILKLHELKTARLIQLSLTGSALLSNSDINLNVFEDIGRNLGINFQLLDDLCELTEPLSAHEKDINPYLKFETPEILSIVEKNNSQMQNLLKNYKLDSLNEYIASYLEIIRKKLTSGITEINKHIELTENDISKIC